MNPQQEIRALLQVFQDGYTHRDLAQVDAFMELFTPDVEVIGTNGVKPGAGEWYTNRDTATQLVKGDWESWGDLRLDVEAASIQVRGDAGWIAASATVTKTIGAENYPSYLEFIKNYIETSPLSAEQKLQYILLSSANTLYELLRGENFIWPLRFTAVVVREASGWKFAQMNFSFSTVYLPDVRIME